MDHMIHPRCTAQPPVRPEAKFFSLTPVLAAIVNHDDCRT